LLFILLAMHFTGSVFRLSEPDGGPFPNKVFVGISGDIVSPGVYAFYAPPCLRDVLIRSGGLIPKNEKGLPSTDILCHSGVNLDYQYNAKGMHVLKGEMSPFHKITLGLPISLNRESLDGLTAIRGIGPKTAHAIVRERTKRGGFKSVAEILSVPGVGPALFDKISPYVVL
ncbi:MAG: helix-hairpin-helix domain-containing protein, partial [Thermodesulfobacteriota bacterium]|nr:helix-hairpin-helix domain-containing protein [Thermodesulfobacteriota bacterium]